MGLKKLPRWVIVVTSTAFGLVVFSVAVFNYYALAFENKILPNVMVAGVKLSGLTTDEAKVKLQAKIEEFKNSKLKFSVEGQDNEILIANLNPDFKIDEAVVLAYNVGRSGKLFNDVLERVRVVFSPINATALASIESKYLREKIDNIQQKYNQPEQDAHIEIAGTEISIIPQQNGKKIETQKIEQLIWQSFQNLNVAHFEEFELVTVQAKISQNHIDKLLPQIKNMITASIDLEAENKKFQITGQQIGQWITFELAENQDAGAKITANKDLIREYATTIAKQVTIEPIDAKLQIEDGKVKVFETSKDGKELDIDQAVAMIENEITSRTILGIKSNQEQSSQTNTISLPVVTKRATVTNDTINDLGINELIGYGMTDFRGSPYNRVHNITHGTEFLNGLLVAPGEEFSTVQSLGKIDGSTGYLPELVIKNNRTLPEYGGGLCQVSTTLFRAALDGGFRITSRRNHSFRVDYYEREVGPGLDATIYVPNPDFKFLNDTPNWILVQGRIEGMKVIFEIYGTDDGRESQIDGPHILSQTPAPASVYVRSNSLAAGETRLIQGAVGGARTTAKYSVFKDGELQFEQTFNSTYRAIPAQYLVGPELPPKPEPTPNPQPEPEQTEPEEPTSDEETLPIEDEEDED